MKLNNKKIIYFCSSVIFFVVISFSLTSCYDDKMEWGDPYAHPAAADLPLGLQEAISRYEALNSYTDFILGVGIDFSLYMNDETYRKLVDENFDDVTAGYEMKHASMLKADGTINFTSVDAVIERLQAAGLTIYGHTLVWHQNQNANYLKGLIAPTIIPGTPGSSLIVNGDFETGITGWNIPYYAEAVTQSSDFAIDGTHSMKVAVGDWGGSGKYNMQINSPTFAIVPGHKYEISFFIKSDIPGSVGIDFPNNNLGNQYPWSDGKELITTGSAWTKVVYNPTTVGDGAMTATADNNAMTFRLLLGSTKNCTYYIDGVEVIDLDAAPTEVNLVPNGNFESGNFGDWEAKNNSAGMSVTGDAKFSGTYGLKVVTTATSANPWDSQIVSPSITLDPAKSYTFSFSIKSDVAGKGRISFPGGIDGNEYPWMNWTGSGTVDAFTTSAGIWTLVSVDISKASNIRLSFDIGHLPNVTYFIDDVKIVEKKAPQGIRSKMRKAGPVTVEKTEAEKAEIIGAAMKAWIQGMVSHYKGKVKAWDVVNEPMNETGSVRSGKGVSAPAADEFYWQDYLGKDYAVTAFNLARQYGESTDILFINDYNLESSMAKCDGLIEYVKYIEAKGAKVDGIGTQMHLTITSDTLLIDEMFKKLAASGKLIKISELDIRVNSSSPSAANMAEQAKMYHYVVSSFIKNIPPAQRYGITVWGISDNEQEHQYWIPDDAPNLWNANYQRKHAYKSFADALAGKDISADFSGELKY